MMLSRVASRCTYANVVATLALFLALGGVGYAATSLPANSVGSAQLKPDAVTGAKVKNGSLRSADFKKGQLPKGAKGATGATGPAGPAGVAGPAGAPGAAGTALGYALVKADGTLDATRSSANITAAMVTNASASASCFHDLPFTVKNTIATAQYDGGLGTAGEMVQAAVAGAGFTSDCGGVANTTVEVAGYSGGNYARVPFYIVFN